ncbi:MAG: choice-of-anchor D domain-containing protein, partial [Candidatus Marinimicrobia bacterium]|nr:choice-of-anchor D domain-containing protein [Candidatus Neomarinimicrobiota bacterium]
FGQVFVNSTASLELLVTNAGDLPLYITGVAADPIDYTVIPPVANINPGVTDTFLVTLSPTAVADYPGTLTLTSNDPDEGNYVVVLLGQGVEPPVISVAPDSLSDSLFTGGTSLQYITIDNSAGGSDLIFEISIEGVEAATTAMNASYTYFRQGLNNDLQLKQKENVTQSKSILFPASGLKTPKKWEDYRQTSQNNRTILKLHPNGNIPDITQQTLPVVIEDPVGDGGVVDITVLRGASISEVLEIEMEFSTAIDPFDFGGFLELDIDQDATTGVPSFGFPEQDIGVEYAIVFFSIGSGVVDLIDAITFEYIGSYPVVIETYTLRFSIPLAHIGNDDGNMDVTGVVGTYFEPTDWFPDQGHGTIGGVNWLSAAPSAGTVPAGSSLDIALTFDAAGMLGGDYHADIVITSNDPITPESRIPVHLDVTGAPDIAVSADTLDFGQAIVNYPDTLELVVENSGTDDLVITSVAADPGQYTVLPSSASIIPGGDQIFLVSFLPTAVGGYPGTLTITSNDPDDGTLVIVLQGQGILPPVIAVTPDSLFADLFSGESSVQYLTIDNSAGGSDLIYEIIIEAVEADGTPAPGRLGLAEPLAPAGNRPSGTSLTDLLRGDRRRAIGKAMKSRKTLSSSTVTPGLTAAPVWRLLHTDPEEPGLTYDIQSVYGGVTSDEILFKLESYTTVPSGDYFVVIAIDADQDTSTGLII